MDSGRIEEREFMVKEQLEKKGIRNPLLLQAMRDIPRHLFVPLDDQDKAYEDGPLPIGEGQTISQPYIVASMIELIEPKASDKVLEIGVGSGYSTTVLSRLVGEIFGVEKEGSLLAQAQKRFLEMGLTNIHLKKGDGSLGWEEEGPFDAILVAAGAPQIPKSLLRQMKIGGVMVIPIGIQREQELVRIIKRSEDRFQEKVLYPVKFVPLIGQEGWKD